MAFLNNFQPQQQKSAPMPTIDGTPIGAFGAQWGGSGYQYDPMQNPRAAQWMNWMRQSDPSARWQEEDVGGQHQWTFTQDHPGAEGTYPELANQLKPYGGGMTLEPVFEHGDYVHPNSERYATPVPLRNQNMVINSPIGRITPEANLKHPRDLMGMLGPAAIGLMATLMSGGAASPMLGMMMRAPQMLAGMSRGGFNPMSLASMGAGLLGVPSWLTSGASFLANQGRRSQGPGG